MTSTSTKPGRTETVVNNQNFDTMRAILQEYRRICEETLATITFGKDGISHPT